MHFKSEQLTRAFLINLETLRFKRSTILWRFALTWGFSNSHSKELEVQNLASTCAAGQVTCLGAIHYANAGSSCSHRVAKERHWSDNAVFGLITIMRATATVARFVIFLLFTLRHVTSTNSFYGCQNYGFLKVWKRLCRILPGSESKK